jgi:Flp pilus assembly protein TadB
VSHGARIERAEGIFLKRLQQFGSISLKLWEGVVLRRQQDEATLREHESPPAPRRIKRPVLILIALAAIVVGVMLGWLTHAILAAPATGAAAAFVPRIALTNADPAAHTFPGGA